MFINYNVVLVDLVLTRYLDHRYLPGARHVPQDYWATSSMMWLTISMSFLNVTYIIFTGD